MRARSLYRLCNFKFFSGIVAIIFSTATYAVDILTEENAPFNYSDHQRLTGISTEILIEMGKRAGIPLNIQVLSWARSYQTALNYPETCVYSTVRLPERETLFKWIGPLAVNKWVFFAKGSFDKPLLTIDDARPFRVGGVTMDAKPAYLKTLGFTNFDLISNDDLNLTKLMAGRIDLWITGFYKGKELAAQEGIKDIKPLLFVRDVDYFLACNPNTSEKTLTALSQALQVMQKDGYVKSVVERYADWLRRE